MSSKLKLAEVTNIRKLVKQHCSRKLFNLILLGILGLNTWQLVVERFTIAKKKLVNRIRRHFMSTFKLYLRS